METLALGSVAAFPTISVSRSTWTSRPSLSLRCSAQPAPLGYFIYLLSLCFFFVMLPEAVCLLTTVYFGSVDNAEKFLEASKKGNVIPLYRCIFSDHLTPVLAYRCLVKEDERDAPSFLFESVEPGHQLVNNFFRSFFFWFDDDFFVNVCCMLLVCI